MLWTPPESELPAWIETRVLGWSQNTLTRETYHLHVLGILQSFIVIPCSKTRSCFFFFFFPTIYSSASRKSWGRTGCSSWSDPRTSRYLGTLAASGSPRSARSPTSTRWASTERASKSLRSGRVASSRRGSCRSAGKCTASSWVTKTSVALSLPWTMDMKIKRLQEITLKLLPECPWRSQTPIVYWL